MDSRSIVSMTANRVLTQREIGMSLIKEFNNLRQQMDKLFDDLAHEQPHLGIFAKAGETPWTPASELPTTEKESV